MTNPASLRQHFRPLIVAGSVWMCVWATAGVWLPRRIRRGSVTSA